MVYPMITAVKQPRHFNYLFTLIRCSEHTAWLWTTK